MNSLIAFIAQYLFLVSIVLSGLFYLTRSRLEKKQFAIFALASLLFSFVIAKLFSIFVKDPRPFVSDHIKPLIAHAADNGFPSDHTLLTMTIASIVFVYNRRLGIILGIIAICVGYSRVLAGVHHMIDILGAIGIAIVTTTLVFFFKKKFTTPSSGKFVAKAGSTHE